MAATTRQRVKQRTFRWIVQYFLRTYFIKAKYGLGQNFDLVHTAIEGSIGQFVASAYSVNLQVEP